MQKLFEIYISLSINKVLLEHSYIHWFYGCFHMTVVELSSCDRLYIPQTLKDLLSGPLQEKFDESLA